VTSSSRVSSLRYELTLSLPRSACSRRQVQHAEGPGRGEPRRRRLAERGVLQEPAQQPRPLARRRPGPVCRPRRQPEHAGASFPSLSPLALSLSAVLVASRPLSSPRRSSRSSPADSLHPFARSPSPSRRPRRSASASRSSPTSSTSERAASSSSRRSFSPLYTPRLPSRTLDAVPATQ